MNFSTIQANKAIKVIEKYEAKAICMTQGQIFMANGGINKVALTRELEGIGAEVIFI